MSDIAVKSADRVLTLLECVGESSRAPSHAELAEVLDIPKSSLTQLLKTLVARRWLVYSPEAKTYALGPGVLALARQVQRVGRLVDLAPDILARLSAAVGETSALNLRRGDESEVAVTVLSSQRLISVMREGDRAPLYATSGGKAILASLTESALAAYLARVQFEPVTGCTLTSPEQLRADLKTTRARGYALSIEEFTPGVVGVGVPLLDKEGEALAAINIAMPASRFAKDKLGPLVSEILAATEELGKALAHASP